MTETGEFDAEDYRAQNKWCGYCGRMLVINLPQFLKHLNTCEVESGKSKPIEEGAMA